MEHRLYFVALSSSDFTRGDRTTPVHGLVWFVPACYKHLGLLVLLVYMCMHAITGREVYADAPTWCCPTLLQVSARTTARP